jgi:hypothetical protein
MNIVLGNNDRKNKTILLKVIIVFNLFLFSFSSIFCNENEYDVKFKNLSISEFSKWDTKEQVNFFNQLSQPSRFKLLSEFLPGKIFFLKILPAKRLDETIFIKFLNDGDLLYKAYGSKNNDILKLSWEIKSDSIIINNPYRSILFPDQLSSDTVLSKQVTVISENKNEDEYRKIQFVFFDEDQVKILLYISIQQDKKFEKYFD